VSALGKTFSGESAPQPLFLVPIPTPVILDNGNWVTPRRVFVLFNADPGVEITQVIVDDGPSNNYDNTFTTPVSGKHDGTNGVMDLEENATQFTLPGSPSLTSVISDPGADEQRSSQGLAARIPPRIAGPYRAPIAATGSVLPIPGAVDRTQTCDCQRDGPPWL
jgi:hypothetical protein